jgi:hypothetical protein
MIEAILIIAICSAALIAIRQFGVAEKICDRMITRTNGMIQTIRSLQKDLKGKKVRK